jgi:3-hydroxyisobutyrate dehydrogenase-like beta-hydroxyacid dehydrogenase
LTTVAFIGFGALGAALAEGFARGGATDVRAYTRPRADPESTAAINRRIADAGARACESIEKAIDGVDVVVAAVPAGAAGEVAAGCAGAIPAGALYVDPSPLQPRAKEQLSAMLAGAGAAYVDVAVLGTVATDGLRVPMLAAGAGATRWAELGSSLGLNVSVVSGPPGRASTVKLLRSVFMKGRDALILEMLVASRRYGVEKVVLESIPAGEPFGQLAERVVCSLALYSERRADELAASAELLKEAGVDPFATHGGVERLRWLAEMGVREHFGAERPDDAEAVLSYVEALTADAAVRL